MKPQELKNCIGKRCEITYLDRLGNRTRRKLQVQDTVYVPLYGDYLIGDVEDICLDRVESVEPAG